MTIDDAINKKSLIKWLNARLDDIELKIDSSENSNKVLFLTGKLKATHDLKQEIEKSI